MTHAALQKVFDKNKRTDHPAMRPGDILKVHVKIMKAKKNASKLLKAY